MTNALDYLRQSMTVQIDRPPAHATPGMGSFTRLITASSLKRSRRTAQSWTLMFWASSSR